MEITNTLYATDRRQWRIWLSENHAVAKDIWLIFFRKDCLQQGISYDEAVEEALCYGWIDSTRKKMDDSRSAQRFCPRRKNSNLSEMNKERIRRLIETKRMTPFGLESIRHHLDHNNNTDDDSPVLREFMMPEDILTRLKVDNSVWENFQKFPEYYKKIRIGWIDGARKRPEEFEKRLRYFIRMTAKNKTFGMIQ